eukprot:3242011-Rhodomonas_salina.2
MDASASFREGMRKAFVQVCLVIFSGDVVEQPDEVYFRRWVGSDPGAMLSARASGLLAGLLEVQQADMMTISNLIDDSNLVDQVVGDGEDER